MSETAQPRSRLAVDTVLRRLLGFESNRPLPSEATFSRAFAEFARTGLAAKAHEALIRQHLGTTVIGPHCPGLYGHPCPGARAEYSAAKTAALNASKAAKADEAPKWRGRPPAGSSKTDKGKKRNAQGNFNTWVGYKLHLDVACCGVPITAALSSASVYDNQVSVPLARLSGPSASRACTR